MTQRVLLIEDDSAIARVILNALSQSNDEPFEVIWVRRGCDGLERLEGIGAIRSCPPSNAAYAAAQTG
jgi:DNA-binding response OmpR family regulator